MGTFLAAKNFIVNCPLPVMEIPVAPVHDSALRFRAVCDKRITLPLSSLRAFDSVYKLVSGLSKSSMVEVKVNWRCNVVHDWVEQVLQEAAGALYDRLGYSQDLIRQLGCSPPLGASGPGGGAAHRTRAPRSRRSRAGSTSTSTSPRRRSTCFGPPWECGLVLLLQITGWHKDKATCLQLVMDEPPEQLYNQWIRDRMEFYKRVEPTEPPRNERPVLGDASTLRMRFSSSNGLGDVSTALWSVILSNPEKSGLAAIHSVAKEAILKGESR